LLKFHPDKCKSMRIGRSQTPNFTYKLGPQETDLAQTDQEKDIGVIIDSNLTFEAHMNEKIKKANSVMGIVRRTFEHLDEHSFLTLYKSLARPHLEYANQIWAPHSKKHIQAIENVQRRATKLIPGFKDLEYEERLRRLNLPTLAYRRLRGDMIEMFKILQGIYDTSVTDGFVHLSTTDTRGNDLKIYKERARLNIRKFSFVNRSTDIWNSLPNSVIQAPSVISFERRLDKHWRNHPIRWNHMSEALPMEIRRMRTQNSSGMSSDENEELAPEAEMQSARS
jgi:ribonuclease P/MRP protein subunit RPP40